MSQPKSIKIAPSILSADFARLKEEIDAVTQAGADLLHLDVMDGHFVPNITIGPCVVKSIKNVASLPLDIHLMISEPEKYLQAFVDAGSDWITFHIEAVSAPRRLIEHIKGLGVKTGISIKPDTRVSAIKSLVKMVDLVLLMSVEPGFGGQSFMPEVLSKVAQVKEIDNVLVSIDGGINPKTAPLAIEAGVDILVAGSAVFKASDLKTAMKNLRIQ